MAVIQSYYISQYYVAIIVYSLFYFLSCVHLDSDFVLSSSSDLQYFLLITSGPRLLFHEENRKKSHQTFQGFLSLPVPRSPSLELSPSYQLKVIVLAILPLFIISPL